MCRGVGLSQGREVRDTWGHSGPAGQCRFGAVPKVSPAQELRGIHGNGAFPMQGTTAGLVPRAPRLSWDGAAPWQENRCFFKVLKIFFSYFSFF